MRAWQWATVVIGVIAAATAWFVFSEPEVQPRIEEVHEPVTEEAAPSQPSAQLFRPDFSHVVLLRLPAGWPNIDAPAFTFTIHVSREGKSAVGERVTLTQRGQRVSGLVDVMGELHLPLTPGVWLTTKGSALEVPKSPRDLQLDLATERTVRGRVIDLDGSPVADATVHAGTRATHTDGAGRFELKVEGPRVALHTEKKGFSSEPRVVEVPAPDVELLLEPTQRIRLLTSRVAWLVIHHRGGLVRCKSPCDAEVLDGVLTATALTFSKGQRHRGVLEDVVETGVPFTRTITLESAPLVGRVLVHGAPSGQVVVRATLVDWNTFDPTLDADPDAETSFEIVTAHDGTFTIDEPIDRPLLLSGKGFGHAPALFGPDSDHLELNLE